MSRRLNAKSVLGARVRDQKKCKIVQDAASSKGQNMQACALDFPGPVELNPLRCRDAPTPIPGPGEILIRVSVCGVCRTDLHVVEGELPSRRSPVVPGHQVVGTIEQQGEGSNRYPLGVRVGVPW